MTGRVDEIAREAPQLRRLVFFSELLSRRILHSRPMRPQKSVERRGDDPDF
jgi:hypothetical protein